MKSTNGWRPDERLLWTVIAAIGVWLAVAAAMVQVEYGDGYAAIVNAQYFLGITDHYFVQRGPLMGMILVPAKWLASRLMLHPLDVRLYHATLAVAHIAYLVVLALVLMRSYRSRRSIVLGFLATVPTFVFFSYAPFLSHDIVPGILFFLMLIVAERFAVRPSIGLWTSLVLLGLLVALVKHTFALCWMAVLVARTAPEFFPGLAKTPTSGRVALFLGALTSGVAAWMIYAWALDGWASEIPFWWRPYYQITTIPAVFAQDPSIEYPWWFYLRNYPVGYGFVTAVFMPPALYAALKSQSRLRQSVAIAWLVVVAGMQMLPFKETRYLAFLMPLSAFLVVPFVRFVWIQRRQWIPWVLLLLAVDLSSAVVEAGRIFDAFYQGDTMRRFFKPMDKRSGPAMVTRDMSFTPDQFSPLVADRYHRIFHMPPAALEYLYRLNADGLRIFIPPQYPLPFPIAVPAQFGASAVLLYANTILIRKADHWPSRPTSFQGRFIQLSGVVRKLRYERIDSGYARVENGVFVRFGFDAATYQTTLTQMGSVISHAEAQRSGSVGEDGRTLEVWAYQVIELCSETKCAEINVKGLPID